MQIAKRPRADCSPQQKDDDVNSDDEDLRTLFCANLHEHTTEELLYELFIQVRIKVSYCVICITHKLFDCFQSGPVESVRIPKDKDGRPRQFGFVTFVHTCTVPYALELFAGTRLFNRDLVIRYRNQSPRSQNLGKRRRIDSNSLSGDASPVSSHPRCEEPRNTKRRFQSDTSNSLRMGGQGGSSGGRQDANMQPRFTPNQKNSDRMQQGGDRFKVNDLEQLGAKFLFGQFDNRGDMNMFDKALKNALSAEGANRSFKNDRGKGQSHMKHNSQSSNPFRSPQQSTPRNNSEQSRGRHGDKDRAANRRRGNQNKRR